MEQNLPSPPATSEGRHETVTPTPDGYDDPSRWAAALHAEMLGHKLPRSRQQALQTELAQLADVTDPAAVGGAVSKQLAAQAATLQALFIRLSHMATRDGSATPANVEKTARLVGVALKAQQAAQRCLVELAHLSQDHAMLTLRQRTVDSE